MAPKFDTGKSKDEQRIDSAITILARTIPEQAADAIEDYFQATAILKKVKDWRIHPVNQLLNQLYLYPHRDAHNEMLIELHDLKEELQEFRINKIINKDSTKSPLGGSKEKLSKPFILAVGLAIFILIRNI